MQDMKDWQCPRIIHILAKNPWQPERAMERERERELEKK